MKRSRYLALPRCIGAVLLLVSLFSLAAPPAPSISSLQLQAMLRSDAAPLVIDVRSAEEFAAGHIPGAVNIPHDQIAEKIKLLDTPNGVALYCRVGPRARAGESALMEAGYENILHVEGGLSAWQQSGLPVNK